MTVPRVEPLSLPKFQVVTLQQVKRQVNVPLSLSDHDDRLRDLLSQAIQTTQHDQSRAGAEQSFTWKPLRLVASRIPLPLSNVTEIVSVYYVAAGSSVELPSNQYALNTAAVRPELVLADQTSQWPDVDAEAAEPWIITFKAGASQFSQVPGDFTQSVLALVDTMFHTPDNVQDLGPIYGALTNRQFSSYL